MQRHAREHRPLGEILVQQKLLQPHDLERQLLTQKKLASPASDYLKTMKEDDLFGGIALRLHFCSEEQLQECLNVQDRLPRTRFMRLGDILVLKGYMKPEQIDRVLTIQKGLVLQCPTCKTDYNVLMFKPGSTLQCYRCGSPMRIPIRSTSTGMDEALYFGGESE